MPVFQAHVPAGQLTGSERRGLANGLNLALHEALGTPMEDRFIVISEHGEDELFLIQPSQTFNGPPVRSSLR